MAKLGILRYWECNELDALTDRRVLVDGNLKSIKLKHVKMFCCQELVGGG
jgi:hypothetical protein